MPESAGSKRSCGPIWRLVCDARYCSLGSAAPVKPGSRAGQTVPGNAAVFVMERFLYRLSQSKHADRFVLKGALMLLVWEAPQSRPTRDIDMLGHTANSPEALLEQVAEVMQVDAGDDGLMFHLESLQAERITADAEYDG